MPVYTANNSVVNIKGVGIVGSLPDVYHTPDFSHSLLSVSQLCDFGYNVTFTHNDVVFTDCDTGVVMGRSVRCNKLFMLTR